MLTAQVCVFGDRKSSVEEGKDADLAVFRFRVQYLPDRDCR
jgi:hypothetical protein